MNLARLASTALAAALALSAPAPAAGAPKARNVVIFVADGLRYDSVTPQTAPTMYALKKEGVDFTNTHAMYPTLTTANASAIASGHYLGDTGDYANSLYVGFPVHCRNAPPETVTFVEDDCVLKAVKKHFGAGYMGQKTLLQAAREAGYLTAIVGKKGPAAIQWLGALESHGAFVTDPHGIFIDDETNHPTNIDRSPTMSTMLHEPLAAEVFDATGAPAPAFTSTPNLTQQAYLVSATTHALIPRLRDAGKPFVLLFWSRDPDATQHGATDSEGRLVPGINSVDAHQAIYNADSDLKAIRAALSLWGLADNTDIFVTADHGFSTIAKGIPTADGALPRSMLGRGFVALDIAKWLGNQKIFEADGSDLEVDVSDGERPHGGDALIGPSAKKPMAIVVTNGGTDLIYLPAARGKRAIAKRIVEKLVQQPYTGGLFVGDALMKAKPQDFAGALPMSAINLHGAATVPRPDIIVSFRSFVAKGCKLGALLCTAEIADTGLATGQGMHGSFSRADTRNFMAAIGPDFKAGFKDTAPVSNADIAHTLAHILGIRLSGPGHLKGRIDSEALKGGKPVAAKRGTRRSRPAANGFTTVLDYQQVGSVTYFDAAGAPGRVVGISAH